jgi:hypothetical protein
MHYLASESIVAPQRFGQGLQARAACSMGSAKPRAVDLELRGSGLVRERLH